MKFQGKTVKIMVEVAVQEEVRLKKALVISVPVFIFLFYSVGLSLNDMFSVFITRGLQNSLFTLFESWEKVFLFASQILNSYQEDIEAITWGRLVAASIALVLLIQREKPFSLPRRFREIAKYKNPPQV